MPDRESTYKQYKALKSMDKKIKTHIRVNDLVRVVKEKEGNTGWFKKDIVFKVGKVSEFKDKIIVYPKETLKEWGYNCDINKVQKIG